MPPVISPRQIAADIVIALTFCTRLPIPNTVAVSGADLGRASWAFPVAGAVVGLIAAAAYGLTRHLGLPPLPAAAVTVATTLVLTGCLHEDGLADVADSFGGATCEQRLEIMRDSRIGVFGACAVVMSLLLRTSALAAMPDPALAAPVLIAAHVAARGLMPAFMGVVPPARNDGLSSGVGAPLPTCAIVAGFLGVIALSWALGFAGGVSAIVLLAAGFALLAIISIRRIGGQTGDVVGALEQFGEVTVLLVAAAQTL